MGASVCQSLATIKLFASAKTSSIEFKSGLYTGKNRSKTPRPLMISLIACVLWIDALSTISMQFGLKVMITNAFSSVPKKNCISYIRHAGNLVVQSNSRNH